MNHAPGPFDRFAGWSSRIGSRAGFFAICAIVVVLWVPTLAIFGSVDTWQLVINTATSVLAFLLIALLQNSERRNDMAIHEKLDRIALALAVVAERSDDEELHGIAEDLRAGRRLEERIANE